MTKGDLANRHPKDLTDDGLFSKNHAKPVNRPHELGASVSPSHALCDRQVVQDLLHHPRQQHCRQLAFIQSFEDEPFPFVGALSL